MAEIQRNTNHGKKGSSDYGSDRMALLKEMKVSQLPHTVAKEVLVKHHYTRSIPGGTQLCLGAFTGNRLVGVMTLGSGPPMGHCLVRGASRVNCLTLTRMWVADFMPKNSASRFLGVVLRTLRQHTEVKFILTYADPEQGHMGAIYQATNWTYTGLSVPTPLYDAGVGVPRHSRSFGQVFGTHSVEHFERQGVEIKVITQRPKHRYIHFIDKSWRDRLLVTDLPYPKQEE